MTASDAIEPIRPGSDTVPTAMTDVPDGLQARPMPRLGRGIVWSDIVAEIEHDYEVRLRDAA
ncbi:DUF6222 family protein [Amycolatopsis sp. NPDC051061]|jgi:hypothetical protein|uniref:DUF6222 family protein n=1 Tax=Amycolatopsis sp. NPDC051061 TaxID=3155042 RepID=UPI00342E1B96